MACEISTIVLFQAGLFWGVCFFFLGGGGGGGEPIGKEEEKSAWFVISLGASVLNKSPEFRLTCMKSGTAVMFQAAVFCSCCISWQNWRSRTACSYSAGSVQLQHKPAKSEKLHCPQLFSWLSAAAA